MSIANMYARQVVTLLELCDDCHIAASNGMTLLDDIGERLLVAREQSEPHFGKQPCDVCCTPLAGNRWDAELRFPEPPLWERVIERFQPTAFRCDCKGAEPSCARALNDAASNAQNNIVLRIAEWLREQDAQQPN